jgi:hypothetical protein
MGSASAKADADATMTLVVAHRFQLVPRSPAEGQAVLIACDSRISYGGARSPDDDGGKLVVLTPRSAVAYAGHRALGERVLARAIRDCERAASELSPDQIRDITGNAFDFFYKANRYKGLRVWGLLAAVSADGAAHIWKLSPGASRIEVHDIVGQPHPIGDPRASRLFERLRDDKWAALTSLNLGKRDPLTVMVMDIGSRVSILLDNTISELKIEADSTVGGPIQNVVVSRHGYLSLRLRAVAGKRSLGELTADDGDVKFRFRPEIAKWTPTFRSPPNLRNTDS